MRSRARGHALFVTLIVLLLVASAVALVSTHYALRTRLSSQEARRIHLNALTDAAIAESLARLAAGHGFTGVSERPFGGGTLSSVVDRLPGDRLEILASATYRGWQRTVRVRLHVLDDDLEVESWSPVPGAQD